MKPRQLKSEEIETFIKALDEKPQHTVSIHQLRNDLADAYIIGEPDNFQAAIVQWSMLPEFPLAFGDDAQAIWQILETISVWEQVQVSESVAPQLQPMIQEQLQKPIDQSRLLYFMHDGSSVSITHDEAVTIRLLTEDDFDVIRATPVDDRPMIRKTIVATLKYEKVAGAIVDEKLIGFSESRAADRHVELGVYVDEAWRKRGIASAMANLLIQHYQPTGLKIIWGTDEDNIASRKVAAKLGFQEISRRVFLIPQQEE